MADTKIKHFFIVAPLFVWFERYLCKMSRNGWDLVSYGKLRYVFKKTKPSDKKYFIYRLYEGKGNDVDRYGLRMRHFNILRSYGVSRSRSRLNTFTGHLNKIPLDIRPWDSLKRPGLRIVEIDKTKEKTGLNELYSDRRRLYSKITVRDFACFLAAFIISERFASVMLYKILIRIAFSIAVIYTATLLLAFLLERFGKNQSE